MNVLSRWRENISTRGVRIVFACVGSVLLHALLLCALFFPHAPRVLGRATMTAGTSPAEDMVSTVNVALILPQPEPPHTTPSQPAATATIAGQEDAGAQTAAAPVAPDDSNAPPPISPAADATKLEGAQSSALSPAATSPTTGDPNVTVGSVDGNRTMLQQIARCFPAGTKPSLPNVKLNLKLDGAGNLAAVPVLELDLAKSGPADIRSANTIIQAAMQCGPYVIPVPPNGVITLVANFSDVTR